MKKLFNRTVKFLKDWREIWLVPMLITIFLIYPKLIKNSPDAQAAWGPVYLTKILYAGIIIFTANAISWLIVKLDNNIHSDLTLWQKELLQLILFSVLFLGFILAMLAL